MTGQQALYFDSDGDGDGAGSALYVRDAKVGFVTNNADCNDSNAALSPATGGCDFDLSLGEATLVGQTGDGVSTYQNTAIDAGDVNSDGYDDILVGAYANDAGGTNAGAAYLLLGPVSGSVDLASSDAMLVGESAGDQAGNSISMAGDVDADGFDDVWVGANGAGGTAAGAAYLVLGPITGTIRMSAYDAKVSREATHDYAGSAVTAAGDVDGDGSPDVWVGANGEDTGGAAAGAAYLLSGPFSGLIPLAGATAKVTGEESNAAIGHHMDDGDFNGDGYGDLVAGWTSDDTSASNAGAAYVFEGPVAGTLGTSTADGQLLGEAAFDGGGTSVANAGDTNADGYDDLVIGAYNNGCYVGVAYLVLGPGAGSASLAMSEASLRGDSEFDYVGVGGAGPGDLDADGYADILVGQTGGSGGGFLLYGPLSGTYEPTTADRSFVVHTRTDQGGYSVSGAGDVDGDGLIDTLWGAYGANSAYLVSGSSL